MYNIIQLNDKDLPELQQIAKELGLNEVGSLNKEELVYRILDEQAIVGATKKTADAKQNDNRADGQPRKRSRISVKKDGDKVYTATKDKARAQAASASAPEGQGAEAGSQHASIAGTTRPVQRGSRGSYLQ